MMSNTDRKEQYKCGDHSVQSVRQKIKDTLDESRKESRQALVTSKRFRVSTLPGDVTDLSLVQVRQTASDLKKKSGTNRLSLLKQLTAAFTLHVDNLTEFLGVDGALRSLVSIFTGIDTELQTEAALCLTNLAAGETQHCVKVLRTAGPYLVTYLNSNSYLLQDQCAWALGNLAADSSRCRQALLLMGILHPILRLLDSHDDRVVESAAFCLSNLLHEDSVYNQFVEAGGLHRLAGALKRRPALSLGAIVEVLSAWNHILGHRGSSDPEKVLRAYPLATSVELLLKCFDNLQIVSLSIRCVSHLATVDGCRASRVFTCGILDQLLTAAAHLLTSDGAHLLTSDGAQLRADSLLLLSNLLAVDGSQAFARRVCEDGFAGTLLELMISTPAVSRMVVACAVNVLIHDGEAAPQMLPLVAPVLQLLDRRADEKLASVALTFVEVMLGMSEVVDSVVVHIEESCSASNLQFLMARGHEETKKVVDGIQAKRS